MNGVLIFPIPSLSLRGVASYVSKQSKGKGAVNPYEYKCKE
jgi:hypothetical protein